jgi:hypothetical protein
MCERVEAAVKSSRHALEVGLIAAGGLRVRLREGQLEAAEADAPVNASFLESDVDEDISGNDDNDSVLSTIV